jgi:hypothetical protein
MEAGQHAEAVVAHELELTISGTEAENGGTFIYIALLSSSSPLPIPLRRARLVPDVVVRLIVTYLYDEVDE